MTRASDREVLSAWNEVYSRASGLVCRSLPTSLYLFNTRFPPAYTLSVKEGHAMKRALAILVMSLAFCLGLSSNLYAEMAKEGTVEYLAATSSTAKVLTMGKEHLQINFEGFGVVVNAPPEFPLHRASYHIIGGGHVINGAAKYTGFIVWTRLNGEKIYGTYESSGPMKGERTGTIAFVGGDGSTKGIQGGIDITVQGVHPAAKGTSQSISKAKAHWKIP